MAEPSTTEQARERSRALMDQANALRAAGKSEEALSACFEAFRADPTSQAAMHNLGAMLTKLGRLADGEAILRHALKLAPDVPRAAHALAHNLLGQGRYREAWPLYEARLHVSELNTGFPLNFAFPRWRGEPLNGKRLAIFPEQGLGDQIQFSRFLPQLIEQAATVTLLTLPQLERLFRHNFPRAEVVRAAGNVEFTDPDLWTTLQDIPAVLNIALEDVPSAPYLRPPTAWPELGDGFKIGLKSIGNPNYISDATRSLPEHFAERLRTGLPGRVISLEPKDSGAQDMADTAAIIDQLDLIVSVDTSVAHMAGAMGKPCLLLVPGFGPDWRWMTDRTDSPWYPRHRLFRSTPDGDWSAAIDQLLQVVEPTVRRAAAERLIGEAHARRAAGQPRRALAAAEEAVAADPSSVDAAYMHGVFLTSFGKLTESEAVLRRVMQAAPHLPNPRDALGVNLLAQGRYREGWPLYEARAARERLNVGLPGSFPYPRWQGEKLAGKRIAIFPGQGLGDQIQFVRFIPRLQRQGARVTLLAAPPLFELFKQSFSNVEVLAASGSVDFPDPDYWATLADLPVRLDVQPDKLWEDTYLRAPESATQRADEEFRIGLMTQGDPTSGTDPYRSLPPDLTARLQKELAGTVIDLSPQQTGARDFAETAAIIATLDLIVSVDSAVAHLAGAMGKSCLLMIPGYATDWRWMRERRDSPWYPDHVLYRSDIDAGWSSTVQAVIQDVHNISKSPLRYMGMASRYRAQGRYSEALAAGRKALATNPNNPNALHNLARLLADLGRTREAEALQRKAISVSQEDIYRYGLGLNLLSQGRYSEGWPFYEARTRIKSLRAGFPQGVKFPRWMGEDISGKRIAVFPEQGFGDQLQFARFIPQLRQRCAEIVLLTPPALVRLFELAFPDTTVVKASGTADFPRCSVWTTLAELGRLLDVRLDNLPDPQIISLDAQRRPEGFFRIGFMGKGNPGYIHDAHRTLPQEAAQRLRAALPGEVIDLDPSVSGARDFLDTARIMAGLDLIVSVDTAVGHLAGVIGKPCCLLVPGFATDWRWLQGRSDSPWYPRHYLFRGSVEGDWDDAINRVVAHARKMADQAAALPSSA